MQVRIIGELHYERLSSIEVSLPWKTKYLRNSELITLLLWRCIAGDMAIIEDGLLLKVGHDITAIENGLWNGYT